LTNEMPGANVVAFSQWKNVEGKKAREKKFQEV